LAGAVQLAPLPHLRRAHVGVGVGRAAQSDEARPLLIYLDLWQRSLRCRKRLLW
jgi:hypothetical protein